MSSEQPPLDPQLIEQTKQQIRMLVNEIGQLAKSDIAPEEFYGEFLPRVVSALAAIGGAVWVAEDRGRLALGYQINLQQTRLRESEEDQIRHGRLVHKVFASGEGNLVPPHSGGADDEQGGNPTDFLLVLAPLKAAEDIVGVVEVFQRPDTRPATQKGYLRFLLEMCDRAGEFFKSHQLRHFTDRQVLWTQLEEFTRSVHASLDPRETAYTIANEGRRLIECDRVSVAIRKGRNCLIEAVSGQDLFDKRSNTVRLLGKLATAVVASGEPVWYTGDTSNMAPQVEDAVQEYVDESHSKTVAVLPLKRPLPEPDDEKEELEQRENVEPPIGALVVEQIEDNRVPERMLQRVDVVCQHSSTALANALEHDNLFLMPVWRTLGKAQWVLKARTLPKTVAIVGAILAVLVALFVVPKKLKMQAKGTLEPVERREVFAGIDGVVEEVYVEHGDAVVGEHPIVSRLTSADKQEVLATFTDDPLTSDVAYTLLTVPAGNGLFAASGVQPGDVVRAWLPGRVSEEAAYAEFTVGRVVDENTLRLETGPGARVTDAQKIEIWRATLLARLTNTDLNVKIKENAGQLNATLDRIRWINWTLSDRRPKQPGQPGVDSDSRLVGELLQLETKKQSLLEQQELYKVLQRELEVRSPASGQVITWDVKNLLIERPVRRGDVLMRIANTEGPWQLEILMPDKRMGPINEAWQESLKDKWSDGLVAEFIAATDPDATYVGKVKEIGLSAEVHEGQDNTVLIKVEISDEVKNRLPQPLRRGTTVTAKIDCGYHPIGYVLFYDLFAFVKSKILFRFF